MCVVSQQAIIQFEALMEQVEEPLKRTFENVHQGYPIDTYMRFLKAREGNVSKAHNMLVECLKWRVQNEIDDILAKPIVPIDVYRAIRDSQLVGLSGYSREGLPVFAVGVGLSTFDKASVHYYVQSHIQINEYRDCVLLPDASKKYGKPISKCIKILDMTGLKLSALSQIKVVKPLLQERTRRKVQVLSGCGQDDLLKIMDYSSLPHFCRKEGSGSSRHSASSNDNCYSLDHPFHQQLYNYIKQQAAIREPAKPIKQGSVHVDFPEVATEELEIAKTLETELQKFGNGDELAKSLGEVKINDD